MIEQALYYSLYQSPVGDLKLIATDKALCALLFHGGKDSRKGFDDMLIGDDKHPILLNAKKQLDEYFAGKRKDFKLPLKLTGTIFQLKAWKELQKIPYGKTISYGEQAKGVGDAKKARAVGMANNRNPVAIIVPCHRVIGASGALTGFGGGLGTKEYLLNLEKKHAA